MSNVVRVGVAVFVRRRHPDPDPDMLFRWQKACGNHTKPMPPGWPTCDQHYYLEPDGHCTCHKDPNGPEKILMELRKGSHGAGTWSIPGGHLELGENVDACAERELLEETGIKGGCTELDRYTHTVMLDETIGIKGIGTRAYITLYTECLVGPQVEARIMEPDKCAEQRWVIPGEWPEPLFQPLKNYLEKYQPPPVPTRCSECGREFTNAEYEKHALNLRAQGIKVTAPTVTAVVTGKFTHPRTVAKIPYSSCGCGVRKRTRKYPKCDADECTADGVFQCICSSCMEWGEYVYERYHACAKHFVEVQVKHGSVRGCLAEWVAW